MKFALIIFTLLLSSCTTAFAGDSDGLQGVTHITIDIQNNFSVSGVSSNDLETSISDKLREAGVIVTDDPTDPMLELSVNTMTMPDNTVIFDIDMNLLDTVLSLHKSKAIYFNAEVWNAEGKFGYFGTDVPNPLQGDVDDITDDFVSDWLDANPKTSQRLPNHTHQIPSYPILSLQANRPSQPMSNSNWHTSSG
jgi:hypothetical protein